MNHPNRNKDKQISPTPAEILAFREANNLTVEQAAALLYIKVETWEKWEAGRTKMYLAMWEHLLFKVAIEKITTKNAERIAQGNKHPSTTQIKKLRLDSKLTFSKMETIAYTPLRTWQRWEAGDSKMHMSTFELTQIKLALDKITKQNAKRLNDFLDK